eukprot:3860643-Heterocapsa_arctica.AAC.1
MRSSRSTVCYGGPIIRQSRLDWRAVELFVWLDLRPDCLVGGEEHATYRSRAPQSLYPWSKEGCWCIMSAFP